MWTAKSLIHIFDLMADKDGVDFEGQIVTSSGDGLRDCYASSKLAQPYFLVIPLGSRCAAAFEAKRKKIKRGITLQHIQQFMISIPALPRVW